MSDDETPQSTQDADASQRPLTLRESEILDFLLSVDVKGVDELRVQADFAVAESWDCGCASFDLTVDRDCAPQSSIRARPVIEANSKEQDDPERIFDLLLWADDGWLSAVELVSYGERHEDANVFPAPSEFEAPFVYRSAGA